MALKLGAAGVAKNLALSKIIQRIGTERVVIELRALASTLHSRGVIGKSTYDSADEGLIKLDHSLRNLTGEQRVQRIWKWYVDLEKKNPSLASSVLKLWLDSLPGVKWAGALLKEAPKKELPSAPLPGEVGSEEHAAAVLKALEATHPQHFIDYHVVLVPRDKEEEAAAAGAGKGRGA